MAGRIRWWCDRPGNGWKRAGAGGSTTWAGDDLALRPLQQVPETEMRVQVDVDVMIDAGLRLAMLVVVVMTPAAGGGPETGCG